MLLEGAIGAPFIWAGVSPVLVYNILLLAGIVSSGVGVFVLVRYLTKNAGAALVSAAIFTLMPYRIEHFMHLELQWAMWMPLALGAAPRGRRRLAAMGALRCAGVAAGALVRLRHLSRHHALALLGIL